MKRNILYFVLALSLLFNVFFAAGYFQAQQRQKTVVDDNGDPVTRQVVGELNLDEQQQELFSGLRDSVQEQFTEIDRQVALNQQALLDAIESNDPDLDKLSELMMTDAELMQRRRRVASEMFAVFVDSLSPEQRQQLSEKIRARRGPMRHRDRDFVERFDENGDGKVDEEEMRKARASFREQWEEKRRALYKRFDANDNGQLEPDEKEALREWVRENHPRDDRRGRRPRDRDRSGPPDGPDFPPGQRQPDSEPASDPSSA